MDSDLIARLDRVRKNLVRNEVPGKSCRPKSKVSAIVNKYKYRSLASNAKGNRFLSKESVRARRLFEKWEQREICVFSRREFSEAVQKLVRATRHCGILWDSQWINAVQIASRGWSVAEKSDLDDGKFLSLRCRECSKVFCLKLDEHLESEQLERRFGTLLADNHASGCTWKHKSYDLAKNYYISKASLYLEYQRVCGELEKCKNLEFEPQYSLDENQRAVVGIFGVPETLYGVFALTLKGYNFINSEVVECAGCLRRAFVTTLEDPEVNVHAPWCKYKDEELLINLLKDSLPNDSTKSLEERLQSLQKHFHNV